MEVLANEFLWRVEGEKAVKTLIGETEEATEQEARDALYTHADDGKHQTLQSEEGIDGGAGVQLEEQEAQEEGPRQLEIPEEKGSASGDECSVVVTAYVCHRVEELSLQETP